MTHSTSAPLTVSCIGDRNLGRLNVCTELLTGRYRIGSSVAESTSLPLLHTYFCLQYSLVDNTTHTHTLIETLASLKLAMFMLKNYLEWFHNVPGENGVARG